MFRRLSQSKPWTWSMKFVSTSFFFCVVQHSFSSLELFSSHHVAPKWHCGTFHGCIHFKQLWVYRCQRAVFFTGTLMMSQRRTGVKIERVLLETITLTSDCVVPATQFSCGFLAFLFWLLVYAVNSRCWPWAACSAFVGILPSSEKVQIPAMVLSVWSVLVLVYF